MTNFFMKMTNFFLSKWRILFIKMTNFFLSKWRTSFLCIIKMTNFWSTHWNRWNKSFRIIVYSHESSSANRVPENIFQTQIFLALITDISEIRRAEATFKQLHSRTQSRAQSSLSVDYPYKTHSFDSSFGPMSKSTQVSPSLTKGNSIEGTDFQIR